MQDKPGFFATIFLIVSLLSGCSSQIHDYDIAVTTFPLYSMTESIVEGTGLTVWLVLPPGLNAHSYSPSPMDMAGLEQSTVLIFTNPYFELWVEKTIASLDSKPLLIDSGSGIGYLIDSDSGMDPHIWLSPANAIIMAENIANMLATAYPERKERIMQNLAAYRGELATLEQEYSVLRQCRRKELFVSHKALEYVAHAYGFVQVPLVNSYAPEAEASIATIENVIILAKRFNATHILFEDFLNPKLAEAVASESGARPILFTPMEAYSKDDTVKSSYIKKMRQNLAVLKEALDCE